MRATWSGMVALALIWSGCAPEREGSTSDASIGSATEELCWFWCSSYTATKYPIVLAHGFLGFDELLGGILEYWNGIPDALAEGGAEIYVVTTSVANSSEVRGEIIIERLDELRAITGYPKFNLIGHSQGGLDARYVATVRPDLVASVTSVGSPHAGTDIILDDGFADIGEEAIGLLTDLLILLGAPDGEVDVDAAFTAFSPAGIAAFNAANPAALPGEDCGEGERSVNGIRYYSWGGTGILTHPLDFSDALFTLTSLAFDEPNDGLVGRCSTHLGDVIRDNYFQNHLDLVNGLFGLVSIFTADPKTLYRNHANRLKRTGL